MDERRKATRVGLVSEVRIQRTTPEVSETVARGADLSEGGIGLLANNPIQLGEEVALQIVVPDSQTPISVKGRVVWQQSATSGFRLGLQFQEVEALSQARILQLITERVAPLPAATAVQAELSAVPPAPLRVRRPLLTILWHLFKPSKFRP